MMSKLLKQLESIVPGRGTSVKCTDFNRSIRTWKRQTKSITIELFNRKQFQSKAAVRREQLSNARHKQSKLQ